MRNVSAILYGVILGLMIVICLRSEQAYAANASIAQPFNDTLQCRGGSFNLNLNFVSIMGYYDDTNTFYVEMSDAAGNFSSPTTIGVAIGSSAPFITCSFNSLTPIGAGYRVRVRTTAPVEITADDGKNIRISPYPNFILSSNSPICAGKPLMLGSTLLTSSLSPVSYSWKGPSGFISSSANPSVTSVLLTDSGYYKLTTTHYGCKATDSVLVKIVAAPTQMTIRTNSPVCGGEELDILTDCSTCLLPGVTCSYSMKLPGGTLVPNNNLLIKNVTTAHAGKYVVSISVLGCTIKDSVNTDVKQRPDSPWHYTSSPVCLGDSLKLYAGTNVPGVSYFWSGPNGFTSTNANAIVPNVSYASAGVYSVTTLLKGCSSPAGRDTVVVGTPLTKPVIFGTTTVCAGDSLVLHVTNSTMLGVFDWSYNGTYFYTANPLFIPHAAPSASGYYSVVQKYLGCISSRDSIYVTVPNVPKPQVSINNPVCFGQPLKLHTDDIPNAQYTWKGPALNASSQDAVISQTTFSDSGKYVAIVSVSGCVDSTTSYIKVLSLPELNLITSNTPVCDGDTLDLSASSSTNMAGFIWRGPGNFTSDLQHVRAVVQLRDSGYYIVQSVVGLCKSNPDSVYVVVKESPDSIVITAEKKLGYGGTLHLSSYCPTPEVAYSWQGPANYYSGQQNDTLHHLTPSMGGEYIVTATGANGCRSTASATVMVDPIDLSKYTVYPNPNNGSFTVYGELSRDALISFDILNAIGRSVYKSEVISYKNSFKIDLDLTDVPSGVYYMHMVNSNKHNNETLMISIVH